MNRIIIILVFLSIISCKESNKNITELKVHSKNLIELENEIDALLKSYSNQSNQYNYTDYRTDLSDNIDKYYLNNKLKCINLQLKLLQYSGAADSETIINNLNKYFISDTTITIKCLINIKSHLLKEFQNKEFEDLLYIAVINYPLEFTESTKDPKIKQREVARISSQLRNLNIDKEKKKKILKIFDEINSVN